MTGPSISNHRRFSAVTQPAGSVARVVACCAVSATWAMALASAIALAIGLADPSLQLACGAACVVTGSVVAVFTRSVRASGRLAPRPGAGTRAAPSITTTST